MPNTISQLDDQVDKIGELLKPVLKLQEVDDESQLQESHSIPKEAKQYQRENTMIFKNTILFFTDALETMFVVVMYQAKSILSEFESNNNYNNDKTTNERDFRQILSDVSEKLSSRLDKYKINNRNPYYLISLSSTQFIQQLNFNSFAFDSEKTKTLYENIKGYIL